MPHTHDDDEQLISAMAAELSIFEDPLTIVLRPSSAFYLAGLLQLALRHPDLQDGQRRVATMFVEHVRTYFKQAPAVMETLRRGDRPTKLTLIVCANLVGSCL